MSHILHGGKSAKALGRGQTGSERSRWRIHAKPPQPQAPAVKQANLMDLGPIGMTFGSESAKQKPTNVENAGIVELGPIGMTISGNSAAERAATEPSTSERIPSIHSMTTAEWRAKYEKDGAVDLWLEDEFNAGSRLIGGRAVHKGGVYGFRTGEGPSAGDVPRHKVIIHNHFANQVVEVEVPEDRYILWEAEEVGLQLPYACRMGCCTACAVRVKEGEVYQPEALGISAELKAQGYALMCVGFPMSDAVLETVNEDEVYDLQFGQSFAQQALDPTNAAAVERDDFALQIASMDE